MGNVVIGVDVGGTFTDLFALSHDGRTLTTAKVPSTRLDQSAGILSGIKALNQGPGDVSTVIHGTTVGTNALLERQGARIGVITTRGFRDVLEMRRRDRPQTWGLWGQFEPIVPRNFRLEVDERVLADGTVLEAVDEAAVVSAATQLRDMGAQALCIFFVNSYANPANEQIAQRAAQAVWPNAHITVSSNILPEIREFERASTASLNAYLQPVVGDYLERLETGLRAASFESALLIVQSNGGIMSAATARALPVRTALSGPAAGVIAAARIAQAAGINDIITCDMGGTSFDVAVVANGRSTLAAQCAIDFGMVIRTPMVEITTIGAGGGSIASVDRGGLLQIGPASAGSDPGPACYGLGNPLPTVTDANLVLGRINPDRPIGGRIDGLDADAAERAIATSVGTPLGLDTVAAAEAILRVANARMAGAIRLVSVERGHDPARFAAMPFGGAGALHVGALIRDVGLARAIVPRFPGVTSALGCVLADMRHDTVHTLNQPLDGLDTRGLAQRMRQLGVSGRDVVQSAGVHFDALEVEFELDMLYVGQSHTVAVPLTISDPDAVTNPEVITVGFIRKAFESAYLGAYGRLLGSLPMRVQNLRVSAIGKRPAFDLSAMAPCASNTIDDAVSGRREVWDAGQWRLANVYDRLALPVGATLHGPALFEQDDATVFLDTGFTATVDALGNLLITPDDA